ncbi:MAG: hypothetical protein AB3A66_10625 [Nodularia sp. CChRGM 3473]
MLYITNYYEDVTLISIRYLSYGSEENVGYFLRNIASTINDDNFSELPKAQRYLEDWEMKQLADAAKQLGGKHGLIFSLLFL